MSNKEKQRMADIIVVAVVFVTLFAIIGAFRVTHPRPVVVQPDTTDLEEHEDPSLPDGAEAVR